MKWIISKKSRIQMNCAAGSTQKKPAEQLHRKKLGKRQPLCPPLLWWDGGLHGTIKYKVLWKNDGNIIFWKNMNLFTDKQSSNKRTTKFYIWDANKCCERLGQGKGEPWKIRFFRGGGIRCQGCAMNFLKHTTNIKNIWKHVLQLWWGIV